MQHRLRFFLLSIWIALSVNALQAQAPVGFDMPAINNAMPDQILNFPVTVQNFDSVLSVQFVIRWDPAVLQYYTLSGFNATMGIDVDNFGLTEAVDSGILRLVWWHNGNGVSLSDSTMMFRLRLKAIGPNNSSTPVYFTQITPNTFFEVVKSSNQTYGIDDAILNDGFASIGVTSGTDQVVAQNQLKVYAAPNPFSTETKVWIEAQEAVEADCQLVDPTGKIVFFKKISVVPGKNGMEIASYLSGQKGTWYLTLRTPNAVQVIPLMSF
ncbi:MAG: hypothetical protein IPL65_01655 [Lewinellaceae bacterium]|nr:hypothetical protein [Lewinellaceae bacterium]